jgi:excisionase family DNA binding protein
MKATRHTVQDTVDTLSCDSRTDTPPLKGGLSGVRPSRGQRSANARPPLLATIPEVAELLRTTPTAVYAMVARGQLPGVTRLGRRILVRSADLLHWLDQKRSPSPEGAGR